MNMQILETLAYNFLVENLVVNISISFHCENLGKSRHRSYQRPALHSSQRACAISLHTD